MSRVRSFFLREADESLRILREELTGESPDPRRAHGAARLLRGSAQMARYGALSRRAEALELTLKPAARGAEPWSVDAVTAARRQLSELEDAVEGVRTGRTESDSRMEAGMDGQQDGGAQVVPLDELEYSGQGALERVIELRVPLEDAIVAEEPVGPLLDELFDLVRLGMR